LRALQNNSPLRRRAGDLQKPAPQTTAGIGLRRFQLARIAGVDLPRDKRIDVALRYIYGIGPAASREIIRKTGVDPSLRVHKLTEDVIAKLRAVIENEYRVEGVLRSEIAMNIKRLIDIGCYRGMRHRRGLPLRGQRTKTNARTRKGPKKTVIGKKKPPTSK
jgi:small subunit ribosomal protein S13